MTEIEALELGREAVGCPAWCWLPGMLAEDGFGEPVRVTDVRGGPAGTGIHAGMVRPILAQGEREGRPGHWPVLSDPCTAGGLLALVREAWGDSGLVAVPWPGGWAVGRLDVVNHELDLVDKHGQGPTEPHALVSALRAAPTSPR